MDVITLLSLYLISQNPDFKGNLCSLFDKIKQSEEMLNFLKSLSVFPCAQSGAACAPDPPPEQSPRSHDCPDPPQNTSDVKERVEINAHDGEKEKRSTNSPLSSVGGDLIEKYVTQYLRR